MTTQNLPQSDSSNNSPAGDKISRRLLLRNSAAALGLMALAKAAPPTGSAAHEMDSDPALDSEQFKTFSDMVGHLVALRNYLIETPRPVDPYKLIRLHDEAQHDAGDLHQMLGERTFEQAVLLAVADPAAYQVAVNDLYPEPERSPAVTEADQMSPAQTKEWWEDQALRLGELSRKAWETAQAIGK